MFIRAVALGLMVITNAWSGLPAESKTIRLIIKYKNPTLTQSLINTQIQKAVNMPIKSLEPMANGAYVVTLSTQQQFPNALDTVLMAFKNQPDVVYALEDRVGHIKLVPSPKTMHEEPGNSILSHDSQWDEFTRPAGVMLESSPNLKDGAWAYTTGKSNSPVVVAVLDTGIMMNEGIVSNLVKGEDGSVFGWNFAGNNSNVEDDTDTYHGTHVAGTIAGVSPVFLGVGEQLKILPVKIPAASGLFYESAVINAIYWSTGGDVPGVPKNIHPAKVLNMSFGVDSGPGKEIAYCDEALQDAVFFARNKGAVLVVAAGNDNVWEHMNAPAACNGTVKVASTGPEGLRSYFSNYGPSVTLAAPGGDKRYGVKGGILSTVNPGGGYQNSGYDFYQGTSMASPHVAGVAGLILSASTKKLTPEQTEQILYATTHEFGKSVDENKSCVGKKPCGHGILDAENAVLAALSGFDEVFSAPKLSSKPKIFHDGHAQWIMSHDGAINAHAQIVQKDDGQIYAQYGSLRYRLVQDGYSKCSVIGFDGVGCYY